VKKRDFYAAKMKNYQQISYLSFTSNNLNWWGNLSTLSCVNNKWPTLQYGFHQFHSIDSGQIAELALLDVSATFDCVDHYILLSRL